MSDYLSLCPSSEHYNDQAVLRDEQTEAQGLRKLAWFVLLAVALGFNSGSLYGRLHLNVLLLICERVFLSLAGVTKC